MPGRILVDTTPLRESRDFRLLFTGQLVSMLGTQLTVVAIPYQVYSMTHSSLQVGAISLAQLFPFLAGALAAGPIGDSVDRRPIMIWTAVAGAVTSAGAGGQRRRAPPLSRRALPDQRVGGGVLRLLQHGPFGLGPRAWSSGDTCRRPSPSCRSNSSSGAIVGPALSGILLVVGLRLVYALDAVSFVAAVVMTVMLHPIPPAHEAGGDVDVAVDQGGPALPAHPPGPAGRLPDRHQRHGVRHATGPVPGHGGVDLPRRARSPWASSTRRPVWVRFVGASTTGLGDPPAPAGLDGDHRGRRCGAPPSRCSG